MKHTTSFFVDARGALRMYVSSKGKRYSYSLGHSVDKARWDNTCQRCKKNTTHGKKKVAAVTINAKIQSYEDAVERAAARASTPEGLKTELDRELNRSKEEVANIHSAYSEFIREQSRARNWSASVIYRHTYLQKALNDFRPSLSFADINEDTLNDIREFLLSRGLQNSSVTNFMRGITWFLRWCTRKGYIDQPISYTTNLKKSTHRVIYLEWGELTKLYHHQFDDVNLADARDIFCLCAFTSLRISDARKLKKADIYKDAIHITTTKTNDALTIELNDYSRAILARHESDEGDNALPSFYSLVTYNLRVKEACRLCGINSPVTRTTFRGTKEETTTLPKWQLMSSHAARRTFICNALMMGIAPSVVMKWTGHSNYRAMQPYIDIADEAKKNAMNLFNTHA